LGRIRSRFQAISRHLCLGGQNLYETCLLEVLLVNRTLRSRRTAVLWKLFDIRFSYNVVISHALPTQDGVENLDKVY
ncbi:unnamed protein product, partial [Porites evermanni]